MNNETLLQTIQELIKENKKLKTMNEAFIVGIKNIMEDKLSLLPSMAREEAKEYCMSILRAIKIIEYKFDGLKAEEVINKVFVEEDLF